MPNPTNHSVDSHIQRYFQSANQDEVAQKLNALAQTPTLVDLKARDQSRILIAVIKLSLGHMDRLIDSIQLAERDWRDVLMLASKIKYPKEK